MIQITDLSFSFGKTRVLENLNLTVPDGCIMGLVGINGAGKSTLFRLLTSIYTAESGSISYDGIPPQDEHLRKKVYFLPDDPYFSLHTTMKSMLEIYKCMYDVDMEKYNRLKNEFGLDEKKPLRSFSKGMRRQAYIIIALAIRPQYLFLDEAFDGLDPLARHKVKKELAAMVDEDNATVIISSHALRELEDFCDKYTVIDNKTISSSGDIASRVEQYCKFMLGFADGVDKEIFSDLPTVSISASGKFVSVVFEGDSAEIEQKLLALSPTIIEEMPINFEEVFINEVSKEAEK